MFSKIFKNIPEEVKTITWYTSVFYFGRGFVEAFIPVFIFSFVRGYTETGILKSVYDVIFFLAAPIVGYLADKISTRKIILIGLCFYPLISFSYFFAGITSVAVFIVIARILNGISNSLMCIGRGTYIYHFSKGKIASSLGFFDSIVNRSWIVSCLMSMVLIKRVPFYILFLAIIPGSMAALFIARKLPEIKKKPHNLRLNFGIYKNIFEDIKTWQPKLRILMGLGVLITMITTSFYFFVPIEIYQNNHNLYQIAFLAIIMAMPEALSSLFGYKIDVDHGTGFIISCIVIGLLLLVSLFLTQFRWYLIAVFLLGIAVEIIEMERNKLIARYGESKSYGNINGIKATLDEGLGTILGPIVIGICIDMGGLPLGLGVMIGLILLILAVFTFKIKLSYND